MIEYSQFFSNYTCPKCRGRSCYTSEASIGALPRRLFSRSNDDRYVIVTCSLCGYSELYSLKVLASSQSEATAKKTTPAVEKP
ncbi:MAG: hypothetical protein JXR73_00685 [Candidatus Omnitrophica bacterium]|nr:hypothetical protein [Candidatus Omnitrophota bacterium]